MAITPKYDSYPMLPFVVVGDYLVYSDGSVYYEGFSVYREAPLKAIGGLFSLFVKGDNEELILKLSDFFHNKFGVDKKYVREVVDIPKYTENQK